MFHSMIVPVTSVWENDLAGKPIPEPLSMDVKGQRRKLTTSYGKLPVAQSDGLQYMVFSRNT